MFSISEIKNLQMAQQWVVDTAQQAQKNVDESIFGSKEDTTDTKITNTTISDEDFEQIKESITDLPFLSHFSDKEKENIKNHVTEYNFEFLETIAGLKSPSGNFTEYGTTLILDKINQDTYEKFLPMLEEDFGDEKYAAYEIIEKYLPEEKIKREENKQQELAHSTDLMANGSDDTINYFDEIKNLSTEKLLNMSPQEEEEYNQLIKEHYGQSFKKVYLEKSTNKDVIAIENSLKEMGVKANFSDDLPTAQSIYNLYSTFKEKGIKYPREVILMEPLDESTLGYTPYMPEGLEDVTPIFVKKGYEIVADKNDMPEYMLDMGIHYNATYTKEGVIAHEIGHWLHSYTDLEPGKAMEIWKDLANNGYDMELTQEVSFYAMTGDQFNMGKEYVAEVFAGLIEGQEYSDRVMQIYDALGGPKINPNQD